MPRNTIRRRLLRAGAAIAGGSLLGGTATATDDSAATGDSDTVRHGPEAVDRLEVASESTPVRLEVADYHGDSANGTLVENVGAFDVPMIEDLHTMVWDARRESMLNCRDDARRGEGSVFPRQLPNGSLVNHLQFQSPRGWPTDYSYIAELDQRAVASAERPALLVANELVCGPNNSFVDWMPTGDKTVYTVLNPRIDDAENEAWVTDAEGYDLVVATDGDHALAIGQRFPTLEDDDQARGSFDGVRIGLVGETGGPDRSAWQDVYGEADGWIEDRVENEGDVDVGFGRFLGSDTYARWLTGVGFGDDVDTAIEHAVSTLEDGFVTERRRLE